MEGFKESMEWPPPETAILSFVVTAAFDMPSIHPRGWRYPINLCLPNTATNATNSDISRLAYRSGG